MELVESEKGWKEKKRSEKTRVRDEEGNIRQVWLHT